MSFLDTVRRAKTYLEEQGRVSLRALKLEFELDDEQLEALVEELVDIQQLAAHEGNALELSHSESIGFFVHVRSPSRVTFLTFQSVAGQGTPRFLRSWRSRIASSA